MSDRKTALTGVALACLSTSLGGMTVAFTRAIIAETDPLSLTFARYGIGAIALLAFAMLTVKMPRFERRDAIAMIPLAIVMFAAFPYFMAKGLEDTTSAHGGLLFATMPMITMVLGATFGVESLTRLKTAAVGVLTPRNRT